MTSVPELLLYAPVAVWAVTGLGLAYAFRRATPALLLRLAFAFLALWALLATATLLWVLRHGGLAAIGALVERPGLLFAPATLGLWTTAAVVVGTLLLATFVLNQAVGRGLYRILRPAPMSWPGALRAPGTPTFLGRYESAVPDAFSFTLLTWAEPPARGVGRREIILLSSGLLDRLSGPEQEAVVAHELGHLDALDSRYLTFLRTSARLLRWDPFFAVLARALTRREELRADRRAVERTGNPEALARALEKAAALASGPVGFPTSRGLLGARRSGDPAFVAERVRRLRAEPAAEAPSEAA